jgi:hypothetical protein
LRAGAPRANGFVAALGLTGRVGAEIGRAQQPSDRADHLAALERAMGAVLDGDRSVLVWVVPPLRRGGSSPFGLVGEQVGQSLVRRASFFVRRPLDPPRT